MTGASVLLVCPACELPWRQLTDTRPSTSAQVRCPDCAQPTTLLEAAGAAWALGYLSREEFFELAGRVTPNDIGEALAALAHIAVWWEQRTSGDTPSGDPPNPGDTQEPN